MNLLLAMDTSPASRSALTEVANRKWADDTSFHLISVVESSPLWMNSEAVETAARQSQEALCAAVSQLRSKKLKAEGEVKFGDPRTTILDCARDLGASFVYVGSHGSSALGRALLGSVAGSILHYATCSVGILRAPTQEKTHPNLRILLATDGSPFSEAAARSIAERSWPDATEVRVLSAVQLMIPTTVALFEPPFMDSETLDQARTQAMEHAQQAIASAHLILEPTRLKVSESVSVLLESPKVSILSECEQWDPDLVVLGSHGRTGMDRLLLGSVSSEVALHAPCSVEVIRSAAAAA